MEFTVKLTTEQIIDFIQQIPAEQIKYGEAKVRKICAARGLDWGRYERGRTNRFY